jgi:hypothetical protein
MMLSLLNIFEVIFKYISATQCKSRYVQILQGTLRMALLSASLQDQAMAKRDGARAEAIPPCSLLCCAEDAGKALN